MTRSAVIIGAGPGGLASAVILAKAGLKVTVLERRSVVGGRTASLRKGPYRFDVGPTFFLYPRILDEILRCVGTSLEAEIPMTRLDPQYRISFGAGGQIDATPSVERMEREITRLSPRDSGSFTSFLKENRAKLARVAPILERPFLGWKDCLSPQLLRSLSILRPWASLERDLRKHFADPRVRLAFSFQSKYLGMSPFRCPSLFSILSFLEYEHGVFHPTGGCGEVSERLADVARRLGVDIRLDEPVEEIVFHGRRAVAARTATELHSADAIVVNADFARAMTRLVPDRLRRRWTDRKIEKKQFSCSTFMLYLGLEGTFPELPHHSIHIAKDYERNLEEIERKHVLSSDPSFYVQNACVTDGTLAPEGHSTLYVLAPVTQRHPNVNWSTEAPRFRKLLLSKLEQIGIRNIEKRIRFEAQITPDEWDRDFEIHRGATFNLAHNFSQMLHLRPRNRFEDVDGVYLVGGGTHPGSGLPVIFESARITSRLLLDDVGVRYPETAAQPAPLAGGLFAEAV